MTKSAGKAKPRKRLSPSEREKLLLDGAIQYVTKYGFSFSTRDLALYLGVSQSLLYKYFSSKQVLIEKIYDTIYLGRWNREWDEILTDRNLSIATRLERYLLDYATVVMREDWVRMLLLCAFEEPGVPQQYIEMLHCRIFEVWLDEHLLALGFSHIPNPKDWDMALEMIWGFHSSIFYLGVRIWVYQMPVKLPAKDMIVARLQAFLPGFEHFLEKVAA
jgi:AcrR family transcriptional regulator